MTHRWTTLFFLLLMTSQSFASPAWWKQWFGNSPKIESFRDCGFLLTDLDEAPATNQVGLHATNLVVVPESNYSELEREIQKLIADPDLPKIDIDFQKQVVSESLWKALEDQQKSYEQNPIYKTKAMLSGNSSEVYDADPNLMRVKIENGLVYDMNGNLYDTRNASWSYSEGRKIAIFVMDKFGDIYISKFHEHGVFHHSHILSVAGVTGGAAVAGAGAIEIHEGRIIYLNDYSGHYRPSAPFTVQVLHRLLRGLVDLTQIKLQFRSQKYFGPTFTRSIELLPKLGSAHPK